MARADTSKLHILPGDPPIEVRLRRSARAQRFSLRVSRTDGRVSLSLPVWAAETEALKFLSERESWVRHHFEAAPPVRMPAIGATLPVMGTERPIIAGPGRVARFDGTSISVPDDDKIGPRIRAMLQAMAREHLTRAAALAATALGKPYGRITLRDPKTRWGSCTSAGDLMFSWRLIMAPPGVLDYVAAHEVAHLVEMNHSPAFWSLCGQLYPDHREKRDWLRTDGPALLALRFDAASDLPGPNTSS